MISWAAFCVLLVIMIVVAILTLTLFSLILFKVTVFYTFNVSPKAQRLLTDSRP